VKTLAEQTTKATEEIASQIAAIQGSTQDAVSAIGAISNTIAEIDHISTTIAAAIEEQGVATIDISRNMHEAAKGTGVLSKSVGQVRHRAEKPMARPPICSKRRRTWRSIPTRCSARSAAS
jgi:methyl-accepting chemotaxis protein